MNWVLVQNSLLVGALSAVLATGLGLGAALFVAGLDSGSRTIVLALAVGVLALPSFLVTNCWLGLLGHTGAWKRWLPLDIYSLGGTIWILVLSLWPIVMFVALAAWQKLEAAHLDVDPALTGGPLIRHLLLPVAWPAVVPASVLVLVLALNNFAVPALLQVKVLPAEVWLQFSTNFDTGAALLAGAPLVLIPLLALALLARRELSWPRRDGALEPARFRRGLGFGWWLAAGAFTVLLLGLSALLPLIDLLVSRSSWVELPGAFAAGRGAVLASFGFAATTATLTVAAGLLTWRWRGFGLSWLVFLVPGVVLGVALVFLLNRPLWVVVYQSFGVVVLALGLRYFALAWHGVRTARRAVDSELIDAARLDGAGGWSLLRHVVGPQIAPSLAATWYVVYLLTLWDVETLVLIVPPGGETLALRIFNLLHYGHAGQVNALCLILLGLAVGPLALGWLAGQAGARRRNPTCWAAMAGLLALAGTGCSDRGSNEGVLDSRFFSGVEVIGTRGTAPGQFNKPRSVALDREDNLYVADMTGRVQKFTPDGQFVRLWQMPETDIGRAKGMGLDQEGRLVVVEPHYSRVNHFDADGRLLQQWGTGGTNAGELRFPRAVAVNARGEIWVCEYGVVERLQRFSADGRRVLATLGRFGVAAGEFNRAEGLGVDQQDRVYVADSCNHRIQVFDAEGRWVRSHGRAGTGEGEFSYPYDVRVDAHGNQFVCEFGNSRIQILDADDRPVERLGGVGAAPGRFNNPWSLALDSAGNLYVADAGNHRVQKFTRRQAVPTRKMAAASSTPVPKAGIPVPSP